MTRGTMLLLDLVRRTDQTTSRSLCWPRDDPQSSLPTGSSCVSLSSQGPGIGSLLAQVLVHEVCCPQLEFPRPYFSLSFSHRRDRKIQNQEILLSEVFLSLQTIELGCGQQGV